MLKLKVFESLADNDEEMERSEKTFIVKQGTSKSSSISSLVRKTIKYFSVSKPLFRVLQELILTDLMLNPDKLNVKSFSISRC